MYLVWNLHLLPNISGLHFEATIIFCAYTLFAIYRAIINVVTLKQCGFNWKSTNFFIYCVYKRVISQWFEFIETFSLTPKPSWLQEIRGQLWHSGNTLDCSSTGQAIDPAAGAWLISKFISLAKVSPAQYSHTVQNYGHKHHSFMLVRVHST